MKKRLWALAATVVLTVVTLVSVAVADSLRPTVVYDGSTHTFSYRNTDADGLFADFQDLMPGDNRTTDVRFELKNIDHTVRAYNSFHIMLLSCLNILFLDYPTADASFTPFQAALTIP